MYIYEQISIINFISFILEMNGSLWWGGLYLSTLRSGGTVLIDKWAMMYMRTMVGTNSRHALIDCDNLSTEGMRSYTKRKTQWIYRDALHWRGFCVPIQEGCFVTIGCTQVTIQTKLLQKHQNNSVAIP